jgi:CO/xanthine dehydrogenase Mo-binding subunit
MSGPRAVPASSRLDRREFLSIGAAAGAGLVLGFRIGGAGEGALAAEAPPPFKPNAWLQIDPSGQVTIWVGKSEMGQGVMTALPMIVAEELEADWTKVGVRLADYGEEYGDQGTGGSRSVRDSFAPLRSAGAAAREMLLAAAAATWSVEKKSCRADKGEVVHEGTKRRLAYGLLAGKAAALPVPGDPPLKDSEKFRLLGTKVSGVDDPGIVRGQAAFGIDVKVPGMLYATVARCPVVHGRPVSRDPSKTLAVPGINRVVVFRSGVAVLADSTWAAMEGRRLLEIEWDEGQNGALSTDDIRVAWEAAASGAGEVARHDGDAAAAIASAAKKIEAVYELPFLAHAAMEPPNCIADVRAGACEIWAPTQVPGKVHALARQITRLPPEAIKVHVSRMGGGFGRRLEIDDVADAIYLSLEAGAPVKVVFSREDDIQHDFYRPGSRHHLSGSVSKKGSFTAWTHRVIAPSIAGQRTDGGGAGVDLRAMEAASDIPYEFPNVHVDYVRANTAVPAGWWRSAYASQNAFATECFLDELAGAAGKDPVEARRLLLSKSPRHRAVLDLAAEKAGWGSPLPAGRARGIALVPSSGCYVALVAEVSATKEGSIQVARVVGAVDCGRSIHPGAVEAQMEGGIVFGLSAALYGEITFDGGRVRQRNFDDYPVLRIDAMPAIEVHLVAGAGSPIGAGEAGVPAIAPAVANAVYAATGVRHRRLPLRAADIKRTS